jgi:hypothetical protein
VRHIADYGTLGTEDLDAPSIGNDPGVLLSGTATPGIGYVLIDVKAAMQDDVDKGRTYSTFMIKMAMDTNNELKIRTVSELLQIIQDLDGKDAVTALQEEIRKIHPFIITNMSRTNRDKGAGRVIQIVAEKYLMIHSVDLGSVVYDQKLYAMVTDMLPLTNLIQSSDAFASVYGMAMTLLRDK